MPLSGNGNARRSLLGTPVRCAAHGMYSATLPLRLAPTAGSLDGIAGKRTCFQSSHVQKSISYGMPVVKRNFYYIEGIRQKIYILR